MTEPNEFLIADEGEELLHLASSPTTSPQQMAHLWADRWSPLYQQIRVYYAGEYRGAIFQETPASRTWSAERAVTGESETDLASRSAAVNWLVPEHTTMGRIARKTAEGGNKMTRKNDTAGESFATGTILTIALDGTTHVGTVQEDGSLLDAVGAAFKSPALWHKKTVGRYMPRKWTVGEAAAATEEEAPKAKAPRKAKAPKAEAEAEAPKAKAPRAPRKPKAEAVEAPAVEAPAVEVEVTTEPAEDAA